MRKGKQIILVCTLMNFVLSMTGFLFSGILDKMAESLNVSIASAGLLSTMHSYGAAIGVPLTLIVFRKVNRVKMLKIALLLSILLNILLVFAGSFPLLLVLRLLSGVTINSYGVMATTTVIALAQRERLGRSLALLIAGNSLALVVGIPLTRVLTQTLDWRFIFWGLTAIMALCLVYFHLRLSEDNQSQPPLNLKAELSLLNNPRVYLILLFTFVMFMGYHGAYNYVTAYLLALFPGAESGISVFLMLFGIGSFTGNYLGGRVSDRIGYARSMRVGAFAQMLVVLLMLFMQKVLWATVALIFLWVMSSWFMGLQLNSGVSQETGNRSRFLLSLNGSAIQLGGSLGASLAAIFISQGFTKQIIIMSLLSAAAVFLLQTFSVDKYHRAGEKAEEPSH